MSEIWIAQLLCGHAYTSVVMHIPALQSLHHMLTRFHR